MYTWKLQLTCKNTLINPAVCLKTPLTYKNTLTNAVVSWVVYTWNLRFTRKNALIIPVVSWVVYTWNLQLACKNALIIPVVSWVVYTWNLQLTCKNALIDAVVSRVVYTWNLQLTCKNTLINVVVSWVVYSTWKTVNLQKYSNQCCSIPANVYLRNTQRDLFNFWRWKSYSTLWLTQFPSYFFSTHSKLILAWVLPWTKRSKRAVQEQLLWYFVFVI